MVEMAGVDTGVQDRLELKQTRVTVQNGHTDGWTDGVGLIGGHYVCRYGGGPVCNRLYPCQVCQEELDMMKARQKWEMDTFVQVSGCS